jgi:carboxyl-terminal processing protease
MKSKKFKRIAAALLTVIFLTGFYAASDVYFEISKNMDLFGRIFKEVSFNYVDEISPEEFMEAGIQGMLGSLDPYTVYMDENRNDEIDLITNGKYGGIGISVGVRGNRVTIVEVYEGYSAQRQGVRIGDIILEANGQKINAENAKELSKNVKGEPGTKVSVKLLRNSGKDTVDFHLIREEIIIKNITYYGFYPENSNNAYIKLSGFSRSAAEELRKAVKELRSVKPVESVVLDLRGNPGGLLDVAVDISNKFLLPKTLVVSTRGRTIETEKKYYATQEPLLADAKLVILINENSASASEIVAGAIQDNDRGLIVGARSFGKGLVQTITPLSYNTSLKITTAKYYTPSGRSIQKVDYSRKKDLNLNDDSSVVSTEYFTINKRSVFGAGGINPDSSVKSGVEGNITKELLAKGMFFAFADSYYYTNKNIDFNKLEEEKLFSSFKEFIDSDGFKYHSDAEKQVDKLLKEIQESRLKAEMNGELEQLKNQISKIGSAEIRIYKPEIIKEIKSELASRYLGLEGRIKEQLKTDEQFRTAVNLIKDNSSYNRLLNKQ